MDRAYGLEIPAALESACHPQRTALIVYDMQVGIVSQIKTGPAVVARVLEVLQAARAGGFRVFFTRHMRVRRRSRGGAGPHRACVWRRGTA